MNKSGTFARHTWANLAKEPALFLNTGNTLWCDKELNTRSPRERVNLQQEYLKKQGVDFVIFNYNLLSASVSDGH